MQASFSHTTAILVFANSSKEELKHKTFAQDGQLFDMLTAQTLRTVKSTGLPYFHYSEDQQLGGSFGERFTNAIEAVFHMGYDAVITLGNDTPDLNKSHILEAYACLQSGRPVLGPSLDGGFYLMGITKALFNVSHFLHLPWQTSTLAKQLGQFLGTFPVRLVWLQRFSDLDALSDLQVLANSRRLGGALVELIRNLLARVREVFYSPKFFIDSYLVQTYYNKGSPVFLHS